MIKRKIFSFILLLRSLHNDQKRQKDFFDLVATFTRPWWRDNFFHLVPLFTTPWSREICFCILGLHSLRQCHKKNKLIFIEPQLWLRYDHRKISFFNFQYDVHYASIFWYLTTSLTEMSPNDILSRKICVT